MYALVNCVNGKSEYLCTSADDISNLPTMTAEGTQGENPEDDEPCTVGSVAMVTTGELTEIYILTPANTWVKM